MRVWQDEHQSEKEMSSRQRRISNRCPSEGAVSGVQDCKGAGPLCRWPRKCHGPVSRPAPASHNLAIADTHYVTAPCAKRRETQS
jgi:hypothetical protein